MRLDKEHLLRKKHLQRSCNTENHPCPSSSINPSLGLSIPPISSLLTPSFPITTFELHIGHFNSLLPASLILLYPYMSSASSQNTNLQVKFSKNSLEPTRSCASIQTYSHQRHPQDYLSVSSLFPIQLPPVSFYLFLETFPVYFWS